MTRKGKRKNKRKKEKKKSLVITIISIEFPPSSRPPPDVISVQTVLLVEPLGVAGCIGKKIKGSIL